MNNAFTLTRLETQKTALGTTRRLTHEDTGALQSGEVLMRIDRFALTTNNITYAAFGDAMNYWRFFPTGDAAWGHMPVWGFADVVASNVEGVAIGERFYGYFPIASHLRMQPVRVTERGFYDGAAHRSELVSAYNQYMRCSADAGYVAALEDYQMLVRPLFITSFMLADFLEDNAFFGAQQIVVSSASSKTGYGTAFCLGRQREGRRLIGATSQGNRTFVEGLDCYDQTVNYEEVTSLPASVPTLYVDFAGNDALRARIHHHFGDALVYDCYAGSAQKAAFLSQTDLPGPAPTLYFAPVQIRKRNADWGPQEVNRRFNEAQGRFIAQLSQEGNRWMSLSTGRGFEAARAVIADLHAGRVEPQHAHVIALNGLSMHKTHQ